jgi:hypothetical protein
MPKLVVKQRELRYAGKTMYQGDEFEASEKDAKILKMINKASDAPVVRASRVPTPQPSAKVINTDPGVVTPEAPPVVVPEQSETQPEVQPESPVEETAEQRVTRRRALRSQIAGRAAVDAEGTYTRRDMRAEDNA